ncbi:hypothetical protein [Polaromonas naphthalenivorans]|uniref:Uncharacterized protein n=1 Tax=Polaromonas naphthalenivorans (strain CJ2) TaxID=365044 RepID=A1VVZ8_POLNA|nr:hypothetical protein [Polaromonas naphthalenivorans]ABM39826.1 conserved hypothetical protein [Polaromonas naphthalenivorans CJ2]
MIICIHSNLRTSLARLALLAASLGAMQASAQAPATAPAQPGPAAMAEDGQPSYRSALEGYLPYKDEKIVNWKETNDIAGQIGGWRAYAKEASQGQSPDNAAKPASSTAPAKP